MIINRKNNTKRNIIWGTIQQIVAILLPFIIRTYIIRALGSEYLGLNNLYSAILEVLNLAEMGFSSAIIYSMYKPIAADDFEKINKLLSYYRSVYRKIGTTVLIFGLSFLPFLDKLIKGSYPENINIYYLYLIFLFNSVISYFLFAYRSCLLTAHQRDDVFNRITIIVTMSKNILQIIVLILTKNYYLYIILLPVSTICVNVLCSIITKRMYPTYHCEGSLDKKEKNEIRKKIYGLIIGKISNKTANSFDSIFVSAYLGLNSVTIYGNYYFIMISVHTFLAILASSTSAGVGNSIVVESVEKNYFDFKKISFLYNWISAWCTICLFCLYQPFMKIWVGDSLVSDSSTMIVFCILFYLLCMGDVQSIYFSAKGLWWENRIFYIPDSICNILLNWIFVRLWGIKGIILATVITSLIFSNIGCLYVLSKEYFGKKRILEILSDRLLNIFILIVIALITSYICNFVIFEGVLGLGIKAFICVIFPNVVLWMIYSRFKLYPMAKELLVSMVKRR